jgi:hypothetical protein
VELARLTEGGEQGDMIVVNLKPFVNKNPRNRSPFWYTEEVKFVKVDAASGNKAGAFVLTGR